MKDRAVLFVTIVLTVAFGVYGVLIAAGWLGRMWP